MESGGGHPPGPGGQSPVALPVQERAGPRSREGAWRFTAPALDSSVPQLRHTVRDLVRRQGEVPDDTLQSLLLILSELATNAVRHAAVLSPEIGVEVELRGGWLRVAVEDSHPYRPKALDAVPDQQHIGGRGLLLVKMITQEAGGVCDVEQTGAGGKVIWAALPVPLTPPLEFTSPLPRP
ncbi:ATP-binding protein [Streptomyces albidus (ex Kaewkla and Franco 2022)]|uniref:ATP-binding protein n=1 Tax=Streptomyces albidus (ex Kaewkla and Franco 2022) TaxID=722709 RepID=UPI0015EFCA87|nr:ATP-binding protein [Streptomyces albidus (ex Kaewkla and Franco 2022)]